MAGEFTPKTPMGGVKAFNCRGCGGQVNLLAPGQSLVAVCSHCGSVADLTDDNFQVLSRYKGKMRYDFPIQIGATAQFEGKTWKVIGLMVRKTDDGEFAWTEYLLFNPYHGYRFLFSGNGHWSWIKMVNDLPIKEYKDSTVNYKGKAYKTLFSGSAQVVYVLGEFYWQVRVGDVAQTRDLAAPPYQLSCELEAGGMIWSQGVYLEPAEVAAAFGLERGKLPSKSGIGANQPNPAKRQLRIILPAWIVSMVIAIGMAIWTNNKAPNILALSVDYPYPLVEDTVSNEFELPKDIQNVEIAIRANSGLDNHWVEVTGTLHNVATNVNYGFTIPVEYYHGVDGGESWVEGGTISDLCLNEIPGGKYELVTASESDSAGSLSITVHRGVPIDSNLFGTLILLSILPGILIFRSRVFEKQRKA